MTGTSATGNEAGTLMLHMTTSVSPFPTSKLRVFQSVHSVE